MYGCLWARASAHVALGAPRSPITMAVGTQGSTVVLLLETARRPRDQDHEGQMDV
jgi:hypothetical protein